MRLLRILIISLFSLWGNLQLQGQLPFLFKQLEVRDGLSHNQINHIFKDSRGFMWFSTASGLNRYDGYKFKVFFHQPNDPHSIPDNWIHSVQEDIDGKLWIRTAGGYVVLNQEKEAFENSARLLSKMGIGHPVDLIYIDHDKNIWCYANSLGCYMYNPENKSSTLFPQNGETDQLANGTITDIRESEENYLFVFQNGIIQYMDKRSLQIGQTDSYLQQQTKGDSRNFQLFVDNDNDVWAYSDVALGVWLHNQQEHQWRHFSSSNESRPYSLSSNMIQDIIQDDNGWIWMATDHGGIDIINKKDNQLTNLRNHPHNERSIANNSINCLYADDTGIIWVGTYKKGISYYSESTYKFGINDLSVFNSIENFKPDVNSIIKDANGFIWIGTNGSGLARLNTNNDSYRLYTHDQLVPYSLTNNVVVSLCASKDGKLWIGTYLSGMNCFDGEKFIPFLHDPQDTNSLANDNVWSIVEDKNGMIWIGTLGGGLQKLNPKSGLFTNYNNTNGRQLSSEYITSLFVGKNDRLIIGTAIGITLFDMNSEQSEILQGNRRGDQPFTNLNVNQVYEDSRGLVWVGTRDGLNIWDPKKDEIIKLYKSDGLADNVIAGIIEDNQHNMWVTTSNGISNILIHTDPQNREYSLSFVNYGEEDGLQSHEFNLRSQFKSPEGEILFGGTYGFNFFNPEDIRYNTERPKVRFTGFKLFNEEVLVDKEYNGNKILPSEINTVKEITLKYRQNIFSVEFSAMNYVLPAKTTYAYMLEGFNTDWLISEKGVNSVTYTNLAPGRYVLRVKAANNDRFWSDKSTALHIHIKPPFWLSPFAYLFYVLLLIAILLLARHMIIKNEQQKFRMKQIKMEAQRKHEVDEMKLQFFTNVSHDLRTPLTLIISPLEKLMQSNTDKQQQEQLSLIHRNAIRLLSMVNQLLDFRKSDVKEHELNLSFGDLIVFLENSCEHFKEYAQKKNISLTFATPVDELKMVFDEDKMGKIMMNLLSNAVKFTEKNGHISVSVELSESNKPQATGIVEKRTNEEWVEIKIADSGIGIRDEEKKRIFDRFWQGKAHCEDSPGSGIGLHIVKEFVSLCKGVVEVRDNYPKGSIFVLRFPVDRLQYISPDTQNKTPCADISPTLHRKEGQSQNVILLVDDNDDFRFFMRNTLKLEFKLLEASNGKDAWEMILASTPDIVISDVMMPEMDGYQLCKKVKTDLRTSHIPLILLTAHTAEEQELKGLETGADDYIIKPFNLDILLLRIQKLLDLRTSRQQKFKTQIDIEPSEITITPLDKKLIKNAIKCVENNIGDCNFSVEKLSKELGISRVHLYKKMMSVTGKSPIEFIRVIRLKRAAQLLRESQMNISEIAYQVGFNNPKSFSRYFKEEFGMLPSHYQNDYNSGG